MSHPFASLRYRIAASIFILEAVMMVLVLGQTLSFSQQNTREQLRENEEVILSLLTDLSQTALFTVEYGELQQYMDQVIQDPHIVRVLVADHRNRVVVSTEFSDVGQPLSETFEDSEERFWRTQSIDGQGLIAIQFSNAELIEAGRQVTQLGVTIALIGMAFIAIAGMAFGFLLTRRLETLSEAAQQIADGHLEVRTQFTGQDEVALVGQTFDRMAGQIQRSMADMAAQQQALTRARDELERRVEERTTELREANQKLQMLTEIDPLTQIPNRRKFNTILEREWGRVRRYQGHCSLILIDIDFFKRYNDHYGHRQGDDCLVRVAQAINGVATRRSTDLVARYGGEEFVVVLPDTGCEGALIVAEQIRAAIESESITHAASDVAPHVTLSLGVASNCDRTLEVGPEALIECADQGLYSAKAEGRNRVVSHCVGESPVCLQRRA